jgi:hypothetical protein
MPLVYLFASSKMEAQPVLALAPENAAPQQGRAVMVEVGENRFAVIITGMGTGNARIKANAALAGDGAGPTTQKPDAILVIGLCGGLTETMREEQIVTYTECLSADKSPPLRCSPTLTEAITETLQKHRTACDRVTGITSPRIASNRSEKLALARLGASVVEWRPTRFYRRRRALAYLLPCCGSSPIRSTPTYRISIPLWMRTEVWSAARQSGSPWGRPSKRGTFSPSISGRWRGSRQP